MKDREKTVASLVAMIDQDHPRIAGVQPDGELATFATGASCVIGRRVESGVPPDDYAPLARAFVMKYPTANIYAMTLLEDGAVGLYAGMWFSDVYQCASFMHKHGIPHAYDHDANITFRLPTPDERTAMNRLLEPMGFTSLKPEGFDIRPGIGPTVPMWEREP